MIGDNHIEIGAAEFAKGMSTTVEQPDGGFSPETDAVNLQAIPGAIYPSAAAVNRSTNLSNDLIAACPCSVTAVNQFLIDTGGYIYSLNTSYALTQAASALSGTWTTGTTDIVQFIDKIYATSTTDVARMNTDLTAGDATWWGTTLSKGVLTSGVRHPLCIFQDRLWIGDKNALHNIVDSSTGNKDVLLLNAHNEITALAVDPASGRMLIATTQGANYSATVATGNRIFVYDGTSATYTREYVVDGMVTGFRAVGGVVYVFYGGNKIGYWNGSGVTFLRKLKNVTLAGADLPYKQHATNIDNTLYVVDGKQVLAYGDILPGRKVWYYVHSNNISSAKYGVIFHAGEKILGLGFTSAKLYSVDLTDVGSASTAGSTTFYTNFFYFPRPIHPRSVYIEFDSTVATSTNLPSVTYKTAPGATTALTHALGSTNTSGASLGELSEYIGFADDPLNAVQLIIGFDTVRYGIRRIVFYYDIAE